MKQHIPLAERMRPKKLEEIIGQEHLLGPQGLITHILSHKHPLSIILWGPPGCGKTSLARLYAQSFDMEMIALSAIFSGIADLKKIIQDAQQRPLFNRGIFLFVDEIHRFNKAQQDAFLPFLEKGTIYLIGATTENPSFALNSALLSRLRVLTLEPLKETDLKTLLKRYEEMYSPLALNEEARITITELAQGDGRYLLNLVESLQGIQTPLNTEELSKHLQKRSALYGEEIHYNLISALHKSIRGSDPDAALYWFCRLLEGGEDPLFIARRLIRLASEDIGLADPQALSMSIAARDSYQMLGSPEGELALAQLVIYLALAPKSNSVYVAYGKAKQSATQTTHLPPPHHILNAPTTLMKELGYGKNYLYDHDVASGCSGQNYFPDGLAREQYYHPFQRGFEREMVKRLRYFEKFRMSK